jgi:hypothetical protein
MRFPRLNEEGGFTPSSEQHALLVTACLPLRNPVEYQAPTLDEFGGLDLGQFRDYFLPLDQAMADPMIYVRKFRRHFRRLQVLFPDFATETELLIKNGLEPMERGDVRSRTGRTSGNWTREECSDFYSMFIEPRLYLGWTAMAGMIDRSDADYRLTTAILGADLTVDFLLTH